MHYKFYSTEDFIQDEFFQQWVLASNEETNHYWSTFLLHYPLQQKKINEAKAFIVAMKFGTTVPESFILNTKLNINAAIDALENARKPLEHLSEKAVNHANPFLKYLYPVAASLLLAVLVAGYFIIEMDSPTLVKNRLTTEVQKTPKGKQQRIVLQDGTQVWLNANSVLKYEKDFSGQATREVHLEGEAFFDVTHNENKPFIVRTSGLAISVLGTSFNVRSYAEDHVVETTLVQGKVTIASGSKDIQRVTLLPNQQALFSKSSHTIELEETV
ncbi:MAG: FecR domain-containing protein, partial [Cyclobacteriaceae bacterium]